MSALVNVSFLSAAVLALGMVTTGDAAQAGEAKAATTDARQIMYPGIPLNEKGPFGLGAVPTEEMITAWDIDIRPDGAGLPKGQGTALEGEEVYAEQCAVCHGDFGEGAGRFPVLVGGIGSLATAHPEKTIGSYWPYASTVYDYIYRAMPFGMAQTLTPDQTYAITAYLLYSNDLIDEEFVLNEETLPQIEMPNEGNFFIMETAEFEKSEPCMKNCPVSTEIIGRAQAIDVTPEDGVTAE